MDANTYANIENALMLTTLVLILATVFVLTRLVKAKAIYVYELHLLVLKRKIYESR
jgi:hypothetical protein